MMLSKAVLIYSSDHGESLGEDGVLFHGIGENVPHHKRVPFLVWYSDAYAAAFPDQVAALRRHAGTPVSHDHLYHTLIGLGGIRSAKCSVTLSDAGRVWLFIPVNWQKYPSITARIPIPVSPGFVTALYRSLTNLLVEGPMLPIPFEKASVKLSSASWSVLFSGSSALRTSSASFFSRSALWEGFCRFLRARGNGENSSPSGSTKLTGSSTQ